MLSQGINDFGKALLSVTDVFDLLGWWYGIGDNPGKWIYIRQPMALGVVLDGRHGTTCHNQQS